MGKPALLITSEEFREWRVKVLAAISLIFGEHSHYIDDFNEISYTYIFDQFLDRKENKALWQGLEMARRMLQSMVDEIKPSEEIRSPTPGKTRERTKVVSVFVGHGRSPLEREGLV